MPEDLKILVLVKGQERYVFMYSPSQRQECLRTMGRFASDPELSFSWWDAAVLSQRIRVEAAEAINGERL